MTIACGAIIGFLIAILAKTVSDASGEEARTRLERLPRTILTLAAHALSRAEGPDLLAEWDAELTFILRDTDGLPLTRLCRGLRFASSLALAGPALSRERSLGLRIMQRSFMTLGSGISLFGVGFLLDGGWYSPAGDLVRSIQELARVDLPFGLRVWGVSCGAGEFLCGLGIIFLGLAPATLGLIVPWISDRNLRIINFPIKMLILSIVLPSVSGILTGLLGICFDTSPGDTPPYIRNIIVSSIMVTAAIAVFAWWKRHCARLSVPSIMSSSI